jgi:hypothetical protein
MRTLFRVLSGVVALPVHPGEFEEMMTARDSYTTKMSLHQFVFCYHIWQVYSVRLRYAAPIAICPVVVLRVVQVQRAAARLCYVAAVA